MCAQNKGQPFFVSWRGWQRRCVQGDTKRKKTEKKSVICFINAVPFFTCLFPYFFSG